MVVEVLRHAAADEKTRRDMEDAWYAEENEREYKRMDKELIESKKTIEEKDKTIKENKKTIEEKDKSLAEQQKRIAELEKSKADERLDFAKNAKSLGLSIEQIQKLTGITKKEIEKL